MNCTLFKSIAIWKPFHLKLLEQSNTHFSMLFKYATLITLIDISRTCYKKLLVTRTVVLAHKYQFIQVKFN
jgi:hypothetical protein